MTVSFTVAGIPQSKGSKNQFGGESNPKVKPWQATIAADAQHAMNGREPYAGPVQVSARFYWPRPKAHYRTGKHAQTLKASAAYWKATMPDIDKCARALLDAMQGIVVRNDAQVATLILQKRFGSPRVEVVVSECGPVEGSDGEAGA